MSKEKILKTLTDIRVPYMYTTKDSFEKNGAIHLKIIDEKAFVNVNELMDVAKEWMQYIKGNEKEKGFHIGDEWIEFSSCIGGEYNPATSPDYTLKLFIKYFFNLDDINE